MVAVVTVPVLGDILRHTLSPVFGWLTMPMLIMAGDGDLVVGDRQAERLHAAIPGSTLRIVEGVGHMIHHVVTGQVVTAIEEVIQRSDDEVPAYRASEPRPVTGHVARGV